MYMPTIEWITFNAFLDTDLYIVRELLRYYKINWYIIKSGNDKFEYINEINELKINENIAIDLLECGKRLRSIECVSFYYKLLNQIKNHDSELIYTSLAGAPFYIPVLAHIIDKKKTVLAIHNVHVPKGGSAYWFFKLYNRYTIKKFCNFQTFSKSQHEYLKELIPSKNVAYAPFILKSYGETSKARNNSRITFLNFGNIRTYKRIDVLIEAAQQAYEKTKIEFRVIIAGKCDNWEVYRELITYKHLFDVRIGRVANEDIPDLFNECDYFVAPYQDIAQSGSSVVAINYDKPIIASKLPAFEQYIVDGETGFLIEPANKECLTEVIINILCNHSTIYDNLRENVRISKENNFSTKAITKMYKEFLNDIISGV